MYKVSELELNKLLSLLLERDASDLHLMVGEPPIIRVDTQLIRLDTYQALSSDSIKDLLNVLLKPQQKKIFEDRLQVDFSYAFKENIRFRVNAYLHKGMPAIAMRVIPTHIKTLEELNLPGILKKIHRQETWSGIDGGSYRTWKIYCPGLFNK